MNAGLLEFVPNWFRQGDHHMEDDTPREPPPVAIIPMPEPTEEERRLKVIADAHVFVAQLGHEREGYRKQIEQLESEQVDLQHRLQGEIRRGGLFEVELAAALNTIATLQSELIEKNNFLNTVKDINDKTSAAFARLNIKGTKKERKPRVKNGKPKPKGKEERKAPDPSPQADG
jgi:hypothetical protein